MSDKPELSESGKDFMRDYVKQKGNDMTHREQEPKEKKTRSDAQLWSRREKIEKQIVELQAEHSHISEILKGKLEP